MLPDSTLEVREVLRLVTQRLVMTEVTEDDVDGLLAVARSNPDFTGDQDGPDAHLDRESLERDLDAARADPARHPLVLRDRSRARRVVGWAEVLDEHPRDLVPWIGLLEVHRQEQRRGYGTEAVAALLDWARSRDAVVLRVGVDEGNATGLAFWQALGFRVVDRRHRAGPAGPLGVTVLERSLPRGR